MICACCGNETFTLRSVGIMPDMCERCAMSAESVHAPAFTETSRLGWVNNAIGIVPHPSTYERINPNELR